ncbi:Kinesin-like protein KIN-7L [Zea mays]|uniref:Kinesin-like protein KIN-7L n=2 Tax=Zea mays TaxID=4577 RepID=A0A3L6FSD7_MAIZE|nr:Kinesin-like protein KIN-7L [Zea mays]
MEKISVSVRFRHPNLVAANISPDSSGGGIDHEWRIDDSRVSLLHRAAGPVLGASFAFDHVFDGAANNERIYGTVVRELVGAIGGGFNGTAFTYGQTSCGKTFTMNGSDADPGIIRRAVRDVFDTVRQADDREFLTRVSYMEIYNEEINNLLTLEGQKLRIHESLDYVEAEHRQRVRGARVPQEEEEGRQRQGDREEDGEGAAQRQEPPQKKQFWAPAPLTTKSWADVEDDDHYFATTASPRPVWGTAGEPAKEEDDVDDVVRAALQELTVGAAAESLDAYSREQILSMEKGILNRLEWDLTVPIVYMFFVHFLKVATLGNKVEKEMEDMAFFFAELALMQYGYGLVTRLPSLVAASAVYAVRLTVKRAPSGPTPSSTTLLCTRCSEERPAKGSGSWSSPVGSVPAGGQPRADNGSTIIEIALKIAFRKFSLDHGIMASSENSTRNERNIKLKVLVLNGSYHGDTLGAMEAQAPSSYISFSSVAMWFSVPTAVFFVPAFSLVA